MDFYKYHCCGNDFIITQSGNSKIVADVCDRRFGIGADGFIIVKENISDGGFNMMFFNSDGSTDTFCGNGSICSVDFATKHINLKNNTFYASDGKHHFTILEQNAYAISINNCILPTVINADILSTYDVIVNNAFFCNTGSPHLILFTNDIDNIDINIVARKIRHFFNVENGGTNIDFAEIINDSKVKLRTFERGVEGETLSCGTGSVAAALSLSVLKNEQSIVKIINKGGFHDVTFERNSDVFKNIYLISKPQCVYQGKINI